MIRAARLARAAHAVLAVVAGVTVGTLAMMTTGSSPSEAGTAGQIGLSRDGENWADWTPLFGAGTRWVPGRRAARELLRPQRRPNRGFARRGPRHRRPRRAARSGACGAAGEDRWRRLGATAERQRGVACSVAGARRRRAGRCRGRDELGRSELGDERPTVDRHPRDAQRSRRLEVAAANWSYTDAAVSVQRFSGAPTAGGGCSGGSIGANRTLSATGQAVGPLFEARQLAAGDSESVCVRIGLVTSAPSTNQGRSGSFVFTLTARQVNPNP